MLALPEDRRERALLDALGRHDAFVGHIAIALAVLEDFPYPSIARDVLAHLPPTWLVELWCPKDEEVFTIWTSDLDARVTAHLGKA